MNRNFLNIQTTNQLKGIAILFITMSHIPRLFTNNNLEFLNPLGYLGVGIFLFISGFGLCISYHKNGLNNYFIKRVDKVMPPLIITTIAWGLIDVIYFNKTFGIHNIFELILNGIGMSNSINSVTWYLSFMFSCYIIFYLVFKFFQNRINRNILMIFYSFLVLLLSCYFGNDNNINLWGLNSFGFSLGVIIGNYSKEINMKLKTKYFLKKLIGLLLSLLILFTVLFYIYYISLNNPDKLVYRNPYKSMLSLLFTVAMIVFIEIVSFRISEIAILEHFGRISYEIYLVHAPIIFTYSELFDLAPKFISIPIYLIFVLLISNIIHICFNRFKLININVIMQNLK